MSWTPRIIRCLPFAALAAACLIVTLPLVAVGIQETGDNAQHLRFALSYRELFSPTDPYPGWGALENGGYGGIGIRFYPPLFGALLAVLSSVTGSWHAALWLEFLLIAFCGAAGVFLLAGEFVSRRAAFYSSFIFLLLPYRLAEVYSNGLYAEFAGVAALSFCLFFVTRIFRGGGAGPVAGLAASYGLLILFHLPSAVIGSLALLCYSLFGLKRDDLAGTVLRLASGAALGLLASAAYWTKMVSELAWLRNAELWPHPETFDFRYNFVLMPPAIAGLSYLNLICGATILLLAIGVSGRLLSGRGLREPHWRAAFALAVFSIFMMSPLSYPVWKFTPMLAEVQFPWRWLGVLSLVVPIFLAAGLPPLAERIRQRGRAGYSFLALALISAGLVGGCYYKLQQRYLVNVIPAARFEQWAIDNARSEGLEFWWTSLTKKEALEVGEKALAGGRATSVRKWDPEFRVIEVGEGPESVLRVATLFYPHWKAYVNGVSSNVSPDEAGAILVEIPKERSTVELRFEEPPLVRAAFWVSFSIWLTLLASAIFIGARGGFQRAADPAI